MYFCIFVVLEVRIRFFTKLLLVLVHKIVLFKGCLIETNWRNKLKSSRANSHVFVISVHLEKSVKLLGKSFQVILKLGTKLSSLSLLLPSYEGSSSTIFPLLFIPVLRLLILKA